MDPTLGSLLGCIQASKHGVRNSHSDSNVGPRKSLKNIRVGIKELDFVDIVGLQELHYLMRWQRVRRGGAPVDADGVRPISHKAENDEKGENDCVEIGGHFGRESERE